MPDTQTPVPPELYTDDYFLRSVEGYQRFLDSGGRDASPRLHRALDLAGLQPGQRVLDIACGRGEVVLQSALRGAEGIGIDYAQAAVTIANSALAVSGERRRTGVARMDATRLAFARGSFDAAFMLDFVEHVYQPDLDASLREVRRVLKSSGRLVIHTSPNRVFEETVYRHYVRNVHRAVLGAARAVHVKNRFFNELVLPTAPLPPHDEYERTLHVNPQSAASLQKALQRAGLRVLQTDFWEPPADTFFPDDMRAHKLGLRALDAVRFLRPLSRYRPLDGWFSNHIWVVAERV